MIQILQYVLPLFLVVLTRKYATVLVFVDMCDQCYYDWNMLVPVASSNDDTGSR